MAAGEDLGRCGVHGEQLVPDDIVTGLQAFRDRVRVAGVAGLGEGVRGPGAVGQLALLGDLEPDCFFAREVLGAVWSRNWNERDGLWRGRDVGLTARASSHVCHGRAEVAGWPQGPV